MAGFVTASRVTAAFAAGTSDPVVLAEAALAAVTESDRAQPPLGAFVASTRERALAAARESQRRWAAGRPLGPLDGVPVAVKDMIDLTGLPTTDGTTYRRTAASSDGVVARRLEAAGAVLIGKTSLHEIGLGGTGINPGHITARNPWDRSRATGGSSSGSAAAVGAGLCPLTLGSDAGGSIRIPAALCGVYGLKPTFGRIPASGCALLCWSLDHLGPLGGSVSDLAAFYNAVAGPDAGDEPGLFAPPVEVVDLARIPSLRGRRFRWDKRLADDASAEVKASFYKAIDALRVSGAEVEAVSIDLAPQIQAVGYLTLGAEAAASQYDELREHRADYGADSRLLLALGGRITAVEYLHAQRIRAVLRRAFAECLGGCDAFISPTVASVAPVISAAALAGGEVDDAVNSALSRYTFAGNLTGFPALSLPIPPAEPGGLPVGLQLMALPWAEAHLLVLADAVSRVFPPAPTPPGYVDLLARVGA